MSLPFHVNEGQAMLGWGRGLGGGSMSGFKCVLGGGEFESKQVKLRSKQACSSDNRTIADVVEKPNAKAKFGSTMCRVAGWRVDRICWCTGKNWKPPSSRRRRGAWMCTKYRRVLQSTDGSADGKGEAAQQPSIFLFLEGLVECAQLLGDGNYFVGRDSGMDGWPANKAEMREDWFESVRRKNCCETNGESGLASRGCVNEVMLSLLEVRLSLLDSCNRQGRLRQGSLNPRLLTLVAALGRYATRSLSVPAALQVASNHGTDKCARVKLWKLEVAFRDCFSCASFAGAKRCQKYSRGE